MASASGDKTSKDYYFDSYAHFGIHEEMLKDSVRTLAYKDSMFKNKHLFQDKVVLDVGCGTSILSMFAAKCGAKHVYGVDMSDIIHQARKIVKENDLEDKITLIQGKMEEVVLPVDKVDIIISEWMGYFLLYESMLDTVLVARDRYLSEGGLIFPDKADMYIAGIEDAEYKEEKLGYWKNVYGFKMNSIYDCAIREPMVDVVNGEAIVTEPTLFKQIDIYTVKKEDLNFTTSFQLKANRNDYVHAFIVWFDTTFTHSHVPITLSTSPFSKYTHWKQTVFYIAESLPVNNGDVIDGTLVCKPNSKNPRDLDISISYNYSGEAGDFKEDRDYIMC
ncbi:S-adenosyl-L-methionine-dependent methyltransferase [Neoconidiobolus thromboides FSU 785]|nr:S-adenosyl-L-methionine-dependent methyltransferase [Neoconidiobolus thromboides FSU 785]